MDFKPQFQRRTYLQKAILLLDPFGNAGNLGFLKVQLCVHFFFGGGALGLNSIHACVYVWFLDISVQRYSS